MSVHIDNRIYKLIDKRDVALEQKAQVQDYDGDDEFKARQVAMAKQEKANMLATIENEIMATLESTYPHHIEAGNIHKTISNFMSEVDKPMPAAPNWSINPGR